VKFGTYVRHTIITAKVLCRRMVDQTAITRVGWFLGTLVVMSLMPGFNNSGYPDNLELFQG